MLAGDAAGCGLDRLRLFPDDEDEPQVRSETLAEGGAMSRTAAIAALEREREPA